MQYTLCIFLYNVVINLIVLALYYYVGLDREGIFRVSGSARAVERLKALYEINDENVEFDNEEDITVVTGLLKLFLRELPDSIIPADVVRQFLQVQAGEFMWYC